MADSPDYDLLQYLQNLSDEEFLTFKELLREEPKKFHLKPISWTQIEKASKEDLVTLLNTHYPGWTWEVVVSLFQQVNRNDLSNMVQRQRRGEIATEHWAILCRMFYSLHVLDLDSCHFNEEAIQILCDSMSPSHTMPLDVFELQSLLCSFMTNFGDGSLFHTFLKLPQLRSLNLYGTNLSKDVVENLCSALKDSTCSVEELLLGKCDISSEACGIIATTLMYCKVKHLSLVENPLKNRGVVSLCELLKRPTCVLETLMLSGCYLTSECCEAISGVLTCNRNLKTLKLGNNNIQDAGVKQLCEALRHRDCKLQCLGLDMCEFTTDCCEDLALALTSCKTLTSLNLDWISLDHAGVDVLCEALSHKDCNLKMLGLDKSALSEESQALLQAVEKSKSNLNILHYPWVEEEREKRGVRLVWNSKN
nr:NACHT, LRR and PYD domains-containing protein 9A-like [Meriones unguiculatus]